MIAQVIAVVCGVPVTKRLLSTGTLTPTGGVVHVEEMARRADAVKRNESERPRE